MRLCFRVVQITLMQLCWVSCIWWANMVRSNEPPSVGLLYGFMLCVGCLMLFKSTEASVTLGHLCVGVLGRRAKIVEDEIKRAQNNHITFKGSPTRWRRGEQKHSGAERTHKHMRENAFLSIPQTYKEVWANMCAHFVYEMCINCIECLDLKQNLNCFK